MRHVLAARQDGTFSRDRRNVFWFRAAPIFIPRTWLGRWPDGSLLVIDTGRGWFRIGLPDVANCQAGKSAAASIGFRAVPGAANRRRPTRSAHRLGRDLEHQSWPTCWPIPGRLLLKRGHRGIDSPRRRRDRSNRHSAVSTIPDYRARQNSVWALATHRLVERHGPLLRQALGDDDSTGATGRRARDFPTLRDIESLQPLLDMPLGRRRPGRAARGGLPPWDA